MILEYLLFKNNFFAQYSNVDKMPIMNKTESLENFKQVMLNIISLKDTYINFKSFKVLQLINLEIEK